MDKAFLITLLLVTAGFAVYGFVRVCVAAARADSYRAMSQRLMHELRVLVDESRTVPNSSVDRIVRLEKLLTEAEIALHCRTPSK